jgi:hypothetical protein
VQAAPPARPALLQLLQGRGLLQLAQQAGGGRGLRRAASELRGRRCCLQLLRLLLFLLMHAAAGYLL